ncbi:MAG: DUF1573 domain-containing protein [Bacteroidales bacterium]|jgi:hypothetical protein|nr:DUF1573 domain-containing protein [Bacteroidales bacterium]
MKNLFFSMILLLASTTMIQAQQDQQQTASQNGPEITFTETTHDYGTVQLNGDGAFEFEFKNTGNEPLILTQPRSSCGCTVPAWPRKPILPGESDKIKVTYNTSIKGRFQKTVTVTSNALVNKNVVLTIKGEVVVPPTETMPEKSSAVGTAPSSK